MILKQDAYMKDNRGCAMQGKWKLPIMGFLLAGFLFLCPEARATPAVSYTANAHSEAPTTINAQDVNGKAYLFLPSSADLSALRLRFLGECDGAVTLIAGGGSALQLTIETDRPFDLLALFPDGAVEDGYPVTLTGLAKESVDLTLMWSANLGSLYVTSDDPIDHGRLWLDNSSKHVDETTGQMVLLRSDGSIVYDGGLNQLRARGNTTWFWGVKKPYQMKLTRKTNLLDNGGPDGQARTWLLLAESFDATLLHNTITLHLGQELGLRGTPRFRPVDLYYDGDYRGYYLVCEKVQVGPGRLNILDYGDYIERFYGKNQDFLDSFPTIQANNVYGNTYQYVDGVQIGLREKGSYLVEIDAYFFHEQKCWFATSGGLHYAIHSPAYASQADMEHLSCLFQELEDAIGNQGVHPISGKTIDEYLDLSSMAQVFLVNQYAKTCDFWYSSTYFYVPDGENKIYAGPLWDFDIAYAMRDTRLHEGGVDGYVPEWGWLRELMTLPVFQEEVIRCYFEEFEPMINNILLGDTAAQGRVLLSLDGYLGVIEKSRKMNYILWELGGQYNNINHDTLYPTYAENLDYFRNYLIGRVAWMGADIGLWGGYEVSQASIAISYSNAYITQYAKIAMQSLYNNCTIADVKWECEVDAAAPYHTFYTARIILEAKPGSVFAKMPAIWINGYPAEVLSSDSRSCTVQYCFVGPTFTPALYNDVDYALVYNYHYFLEQNPEILDECGEDPDDVLECFVYDISYRLKAIETFNIDTFIDRYERLLDSYFMCDVEMSVMYYLEHCYAEDLLGMEAAIVPVPVVKEPAP